MQSQSNKSEFKPLAVGLPEAARLASVSRRSLENYISAKLLPSRKLGRRRVILMRDLERFLSADRPSAHKVRQ